MYSIVLIVVMCYLVEDSIIFIQLLNHSDFELFKQLFRVTVPKQYNINAECWVGGSSKDRTGQLVVLGHPLSPLLLLTGSSLLPTSSPPPPSITPISPIPPPPPTIPPTPYPHPSRPPQPLIFHLSYLLLGPCAGKQKYKYSAVVVCIYK